MNARETVLRLLSRAEEDDAYANLLLSSLSDAETDARDRAWITRLFYGIIERKITLDYAIAVLTEKPATALSLHTRLLLRIGLYQLYFSDKIPAFAAVSETVDLAKNPGERALVNAVLRRAAREKVPPLPPREKNLLRYLSIAESFPLPLVRRLSDVPAIGKEHIEDLLRAFQKEPALTLRANTLKTDRETLYNRLTAAGHSADKTKISPFGIRLPSCNPQELPGFAEGLFYVQNEASQLAAVALAPKKGDRVLDLCAAPGGKSFGAYMAAGGDIALTAFDLRASKLSLIRESAERLGIPVTVAEHDATKEDPALDSAFDAVIADVPCSGLGVLAEKPDLRYADDARFETLPPIQGKILENAARAVRKGGTVLYSTCTLLPAENEERIAAFLSEHSDFCTENFTFNGISSENGMLTLYPHIHGTDGFFFAKLKRRTE